MRLLIALAFVTATALLPARADTPATPASGRSYRIDVAPPGQPPLYLYVEEHGQGPAVVLLHGLGASGYAWRRIVPSLARRHRVITIDLKGFGRSDKPLDLAYGPEDQARLIGAFLDRRGIGRVSIAGHSIGGTVALRLAIELGAHAAQRIDRLVLIDAPAYPQALPFRYQLLTRPVLPYLALRLISPVDIAASSLATPFGTARRVSPEDISAYAEPLRDSATQNAIVTTLREFTGRDVSDTIARYPTMRRPTLLVWCRADSVVALDSGIRLASALPDARLRVLEGCDHVPVEEQPEALAGLMLDFLR